MANFDIRLLFPPLLHFILYLANQLEAKPPNFNLINRKTGFLSILFLILFLITSFKLRLTVMAERIRVRAGDFSFFLAITLLGAILLPAPIFCFGDVIILSLFPWHDSLLQLLARFLLFIWIVVRGIPVLIINCIVHTHEQNERETNPPPPPPPQVEDVAGHDIERGENPILPEIGALNITIS